MVRRIATVALSCVIAAVSSPARADRVDKIGARIVSLETEINSILNALRSSALFQVNTREVASQRLIRAQVALGLGSYEDAALMLYDLVEARDRGPGYREALFFLGEALFQKRDNVGARKYFRRSLDEFGAQSPFYQQTLQRLVELSLRIPDESIAEYVLALERIPTASRDASVPYVRGRYLYFSEDYSRALTAFKSVPDKSDYTIRAMYFMGATQISLRDLAAATDTFVELTRREPETDDDRRVLELAHMALGRLYYDRGQASNAIDAYLQISRKSELFDDALYEIAWVYVKAGQFDRALRALELLALANPDSARLPDVRILEGNLRIRRAQALGVDYAGNSAEEYQKAMAVFEATREAFRPAHEELERIVKEQTDASYFVRQLSERGQADLDVHVRLPPVVLAWLREEPEVARVVAIGGDLDTIRSDIEESEQIIARLERAVSSTSAVTVFPELAKKRARAIEIIEESDLYRAELLDRLWSMIESTVGADERAHYSQLRSDRQLVVVAIGEMPFAGEPYGARVAKLRDTFVSLDQAAQRLTVEIAHSRATLAAVEAYLGGRPGGEGNAEQRDEYSRIATESAAELEALERELAALRSDIVGVRDQAGIGDRAAMREGSLRDELRAALDAELEAARGMASRASGKRSKIDQILSLATTAGQLRGTAAAIIEQVQGSVQVSLAEVRTTLADETRNLQGYRAELGRYEGRADSVGGAVLASNFQAVSDKMYNVLVRADVGVVDVSWAAKEEAEQAVKRLTLEQSRERRLLEEQFGDLSSAPPDAALPAPTGESLGVNQ
jgi:tetratricopeptide (TPR) repeat protein